MANEKKNEQVRYAAGGKIQARISDFEHGLRVYDGVKLVRIRSREYSLLIMEDYFPSMGSVHGRVDLVTDEDEISLGSVHGFFLHRDNEFSLLVEEELHEDEEKTKEGAETA